MSWRFQLIWDLFHLLGVAVGARDNLVSSFGRVGRGELSAMWMTLSRYIVRKRRVMEKWVESVNRGDRLIGELRECTDPVREDAIYDELERLPDAERDLAFEGGPDQQACIKACSYSDLWLRQYDSCGNVIGVITSYYICLGRFSDRTDCLMLIPSKEWEREGVDPLGCNRWFCTSTRHYERYKAAWGQVVVLRRFEQGEWVTCYMRARVPEWDKEDVRAMDVEENLCQGGERALEVFHRLEKIIPATDGLVVPAADARDGSVRLRSREDLARMPWFSWDDIYGMVGHELATAGAERAAARVH